MKHKRADIDTYIYVYIPEKQMQTFFPFHLLKWNSQNYHWASRPKWYPVKSRDLELRGYSPCINNYPAKKLKKKGIRKITESQVCIINASVRE